jgi:glycosyltransferase involved in cell wall biosynthesis
MKNHLKIAVVAACPFPCGRGTPVRIFRLSEALAKAGCEVHVVAYHLQEKFDDPVRPFPFQIHRIMDVKTYHKLSPGPAYQKLFVLDFLLYRKLTKIVKKYDIKLIHAHHYDGLVAGLLAGKETGCPVVYDAHTTLESELPFYPLGLPRWLKLSVGRFLDHRLPGKANYIICVTEDIKEKLIALVPTLEEKIAVVMNGVEIDHFDINENKSKTGDTTTLLYAGSLAQFQGTDILFKAFRKVLDKRPSLRLLVLSNSSLGSYQQLLKELDLQSKVEFINPSFRELPKYLQMGHIFLNPRMVCDGIPQKLLNYMAAKKPIVSFAGSAKVLTHKETGYIVQRDSVDDFCDGILDLLDNPGLGDKMATNAQQLVSSQFSWENAGSKTLRVYDKVLGSLPCHGSD